jgi:hypothetical protein
MRQSDGLEFRANEVGRAIGAKYRAETKAGLDAWRLDLGHAGLCGP